MIIKPLTESDFNVFTRRLSCLFVTIFGSSEASLASLEQGVDIHEVMKVPNGPFYTTIEQTDAMVDMVYYIYETCVKEGVYFDFKSHQVKFFSCPNATPPESHTLKEESKIFLHRTVVSELTELGETLSIAPLDTVERYKEYTRINTEEITKAFETVEGYDDRRKIAMVIGLIKETCLSHLLPYEDVFMAVHLANIAKRNPVTGEFNRRPDGKVIKPRGWQPPDLEKVLTNFMDVHQLRF